MGVLTVLSSSVRVSVRVRWAIRARRALARVAPVSRMAPRRSIGRTRGEFRQALRPFSACELCAVSVAGTNLEEAGMEAAGGLSVGAGGLIYRYYAGPEPAAQRLEVSTSLGGGNKVVPRAVLEEDVGCLEVPVSGGVEERRPLARRHAVSVDVRARAQQLAQRVRVPGLGGQMVRHGPVPRAAVERGSSAEQGKDAAGMSAGSGKMHCSSTYWGGLWRIWVDLAT